MKYNMVVKMDRNSKEGMNCEAGMPPDAKMLVEKLTKSGAMVANGGPMPTSNGAKVRARGGKSIVTKGPFIESKEVIAGYAILRSKSKKEAIKMGEGFMKLHLDVPDPGYDGKLGIRQMFDPAELEGEVTKG